jgi:hypothetical protein
MTAAAAAAVRAAFEPKLAQGAMRHTAASAPPIGSPASILYITAAAAAAAKAGKAVFEACAKPCIAFHRSGVDTACSAAFMAARRQTADTSSR